MGKQYGAPENYEVKLERVMKRLEVENYNYDWSRFECWVEFTYKGNRYRFSHGLDNAKAHGVNLKYGSDAFAQVVLSLEDLARMAERGIYDLSTWISGLKMLPEEKKFEPCFTALGFAERPETLEDIKTQYHRMAKAMHPDAGGDNAAFVALQDNYKQCIKLMEAGK